MITEVLFVPLLSMLPGSLPCRSVPVAAEVPERACDDSRGAQAVHRYDFGAAREALEQRELSDVSPNAGRLDSSGHVLIDGDQWAGSPQACHDALACVGLPELRLPYLKARERGNAQLALGALDHAGPIGHVVSLGMQTAQVAFGAFPTEYVVDDDGGSGVDFTEISDALVVARHGDLVTVRPGTYSSFTLERGVSIVGSSSPGFVQIAGQSIVRQLPADHTAVVALQRTPRVRIEDCDGTVVLDRVRADRVVANNCADIRIHGSDLGRYTIGSEEGVLAIDSRVELVNCEVQGFLGENAYSYYDVQAEDGTAGVRAMGGKVHVARSQVRGGDGGSGECYGPSQYEYGGTGGNGIEVEGGYAVVAGDASHAIDRGMGGWSCPGYALAGRDAYVALGTLRESGVDLLFSQAGPGGTIVEPAVPDPTLELLGDAQPGAPVSLRVHGNPGGATRLFFSRTPKITAGGVIERLIPFVSGVDLGPIPPSGQIDFDWIVPDDPLPPRGTIAFNALPSLRTGSLTDPFAGYFPRGTVLFAQASVFSGGQTIRTNSVPIVIR